MSDLATRIGQLGTSRIVDGTTYATTGCELFVGSIDDGINALCTDVSRHQL
jgi:hypothetical protein